jgi:hypothetical protein
MLTRQPGATPPQMSPVVTAQAASEPVATTDHGSIQRMTRSACASQMKRLTHEPTAPKV